MIVPQATQRHESVKHSVLALSVLHESLSQLGQLPADQNKRLLHHYNAAIRAVTRSQPTTDVVLMTCILFWTIENFRGGGGGKKSSFDHLQAAVKILNEFKARDNFEASPHYEVIMKYIEPAIKDGLRHVPPQRIVDVTDAPEDYCVTIRALALKLPTSMSTLEKAADYLRYCLQGVLTLVEQGQTSQCILAVETLEEYLNRWIVPFLELTAVGSAWDRRLLVVHHVTALLLVAAMKKEYNMEVQNAVRTQSQCSWIVSEIEDLVSHSEDLKASLQDPEAVSRGLGLIPPLFTAAIQCPDPSVRAIALGILRKWNGQERGWSSSIAIKIAQTLGQLRDKKRISLSLKCIALESTDFGLRLYEKASEPRFDFFLGGTGAELAGIDMVCYTTESEQRAESQADYIGIDCQVLRISTRATSLKSQQMLRTNNWALPLALIHREFSNSRMQVWLQATSAWLPGCADEMPMCRSSPTYHSAALWLHG